MRRGARIPLSISTDQEGGVVARVTEPTTVFPANMALGATRSDEYATEAAAITGRELRALGINTNPAPVLDVNINPENPVIGVRSYSEDPELVSELGAAQVRGYQGEGVSTTAKHFPGHGDTNVDSHSGLPVITHDRKTLEEVDLPPFRAAIASDIDAIMSAAHRRPGAGPLGPPRHSQQAYPHRALAQEDGLSGRTTCASRRHSTGCSACAGHRSSTFRLLARGGHRRADRRQGRRRPPRRQQARRADRDRRRRDQSPPRRTLRPRKAAAARAVPRGAGERRTRQDVTGATRAPPSGRGRARQIARRRRTRRPRRARR